MSDQNQGASIEAERKVEFGEYVKWCAETGKTPMMFSTFNSFAFDADDFRSVPPAAGGLPPLPDVVRDNIATKPWKTIPLTAAELQSMLTSYVIADRAQRKQATPPATGATEDLPPLPAPSPTHYRQRGMLLERMEMFTAEQYQQGQRDAIAHDRRAMGITYRGEWADLRANDQRKQADAPLTGSIAEALAVRDAEITDLRAQLAVAQTDAERVRIEAYKVGCCDGAAPASAQPADTETYSGDPDDVAYALLGKEAMLHWKERALKAEAALQAGAQPDQQDVGK